MALHENLTGAAAIHPCAYVQTSDPGAVGAGKMWIDTTTAGDPVYNIRNTADTGWDDHTPALAGLFALDARIDTLEAAPALPAVGSAGDVLTVVSGAWASAAPTGGGGGGTLFPDTAPASPSAFDDEFTSAALAGIWTVDLDATAAGVVKTPDWQGSFLRMTSPGAASNNDYRIKQTIGTPGDAGTALTVTAKISVSSSDRNASARTSVNIGNSTFEAGSFVGFGIVSGSGDSPSAESWDGASNPQQTLAAGQGCLYIHIQRDTSNLVKLFYSNDGISWVLRESATRNWNAATLYIRMTGLGGGHGTAHSVDWLRVNDARFLQP